MVSVYYLLAANAAQRCARAHIQTWFCSETRSMKWVLSISPDYWGYLDITLHSFKIWEFWGEFWGIETFYRSKFSPSTGVMTQIQSSRLDRILWSHRRWKVGPSQKFVNIIMRNSVNVQVYQILQILLASSSGLMGVSCLHGSHSCAAAVQLSYIHGLPMALWKNLNLKTWKQAKKNFESMVELYANIPCH